MNIVLKLSVLVIDSFRTAWTSFALYLIITVNRVLSLIGVSLMTLNQISALHRFPRTLWKVISKGIIIKVIIKVIKPISYHDLMNPLGTVRNLSQHKWEL